MLTKLNGGKIYDPANQVNGEMRHVFIRDGRIVAAPASGERVEREYDISGRIVYSKGLYSPGNYMVSWKGQNVQGYGVASGTYFYQIKHGGVPLATKQMILLR